MDSINETATGKRQPARDYVPVSTDVDSRLRLQTIIRLRWLGVLGQLAAVAFVWLVLGYDLPVGICLALIATSAWLNVYLALRFPARFRLSIPYATVLLAYDILQLAALLFVTGGIDNPFTMLILAPVTVSAATLPLRNTIVLGILALAATALITFWHYPLPWSPTASLHHPFMYRIGVLAAVAASMPFLALYAWRLTKESRLMSAALAATEHVMAREQKLHALDGLAAAAAHELGTPLSTITLVTAELERQLEPGSPLRDDIVLLRSQAQRCRAILQKLTRAPDEPDPLHSSLTVKELLHEAAEPYLASRVPVVIATAPAHALAEDDPARREPLLSRMPGVIYGLGNLIENAVDFATDRVEVTAEWTASTITVAIADDGQGFRAEVIDNLGEPYVTTRFSGSRRRSPGSKAGGMGLGFFIAKTLLERSGANLALDNRRAPVRGAIVTVTWPRASVDIAAKATVSPATRDAAPAGASAT